MSTAVPMPDPQRAVPLPLGETRPAQHHRRATDPPSDESNGGVPRRLEGTEMIGQVEGSGLREPPSLVRRPDGQIIQLSRLLYVVAAHANGTYNLAQIAERVSEEYGRPVSADDVRYLVQDKLRPLGVLVGPDGSAPQLERAQHFLALKFRVAFAPPRVVNAVGGLLRPLFAPPVVMAALGCLLAIDAWLYAMHGIGRGLYEVIDEPTLMLALTAVGFLSLALHECGHAAACRYGGARPGAIGVGIYLIRPVFYCDVTDSYRLSKAGRLRTDLGGVYFNALVALSAAGAYFVTGFEPLLLVVIVQQLMILDQFLPWLRLDGYWVISDLIGVSDLFARVRPILMSLVPGHKPSARVSELTPWARATVTVWVATAVAALTLVVVVVVGHGPRMLARMWDSFFAQLDLLTGGLEAGAVVEVLLGSVGVVMLGLPLAGLLLTYLLVCRALGIKLAVARAKAAHARVARGPAADRP